MELISDPLTLTLWLVNHVTLSFTDFELEMLNSNCSHDAVEILDGDNYQAPSIGGYSYGSFGRTKHPEPNHSLWISFQ